MGYKITAFLWTIC